MNSKKIISKIVSIVIIIIAIVRIVQLFIAYKQYKEAMNHFESNVQSILEDAKEKTRNLVKNQLEHYTEDIQDGTNIKELINYVKERNESEDDIYPDEIKLQLDDTIEKVEELITKIDDSKQYKVSLMDEDENGYVDLVMIQEIILENS